MEIDIQPKLRFHGVDVVNLKFEANNMYDGKTSIDIKIEPKVFYVPDRTSEFKIIMEVSLRCEGFFILELIGVGNFEFDSEFGDEELKKIFINANAPAIMFPYIRSFISTLTSNLGNLTGSLVIPTQFFHGELPEVIE